MTQMLMTSLLLRMMMEIVTEMMDQVEVMTLTMFHSLNLINQIQICVMIQFKEFYMKVKELSNIKERESMKIQFSRDHKDGESAHVE